MAQTFLLSVVLLSALSFHGALGISGCRIHQVGLEKYSHSTKDHWAHALEGPVKELSIPSLPGLLSCRILFLTCEHVKVNMRGPFGVDIVVCLAVEIQCLVDMVRVALCATLGLKAVPLGLSVDSCSAQYVEVSVVPFRSLPLSVVEKLLAPVLNPVICGESPKIAAELNVMLNFRIAPLPLIRGCHYICTMPHAPILTFAYLDVIFGPEISCGGAVVPWPHYPIYYPPPTLEVDRNICYFMNENDMGNIMAALRGREVFNHEVTLTALTTTVIMDRIPEAVYPRNLLVVMRILCISITVNFSLNTVVSNADFNVSVGYLQPEFIHILQITVKIRLIFHMAIECHRGLLILAVDDVSYLQITTSCAGRPCTVPSPVIEELFQIREHCRDLFNDRLKGGIPWPFPINCSCSICSKVNIVLRFLYWCCDLSHLP